MESNEIDQMIDDNQRGQNTQPQWQSNGNGVSSTYPRTDDDDDDNVETVEDDVRREWAPDNEVPEPIQRTQSSSDENEDDTDDEDRNDRGQQPNYQSQGMDNVENDVRRETEPDNFGQGRQPLFEESEEDSEDYDRANRDQQQNLQTPQSSHTEDEQENAADEIRTDFAGDGFRREANPDNNEQGGQQISNENRGGTEEDYRADRDQRQSYQTPLSDHPEYDRPSNPLSDQNADESNEDIPRRTDNPNEIPDRDQNRGFRSPVSDYEETV